MPVGRYLGEGETHRQSHLDLVMIAFLLPYKVVGSEQGVQTLTCVIPHRHCQVAGRLLFLVNTICQMDGCLVIGPSVVLPRPCIRQGTYYLNGNVRGGSVAWDSDGRVRPSEGRSPVNSK